MKVKLLIAAADAIYTGHLSDNISEHHADVIDVSVCNSLECVADVLSRQKYDVALIDGAFINSVDISQIHLPLLLCSESEAAIETPAGTGRVQKYQRVSSIVASVLEQYAGVSKNRYVRDSNTANITAVWSPAGGTGRTTVALAYAIQKISEGSDVFYLNLEDFSSLPGYLNDNGKSISSVFEMLDSDDGNIKMLIKGISSKDKGISYLCRPDNYDDMYVLTSDNVGELITVCSGLADDLVIDLPCACDTRTIKTFELADKIMIVTENTASAGAKLEQFSSQNNIFENIKDKSILIANKGAQLYNSPIDNIISLQFVQTGDAMAICKKLSETGSFNE